MSTAAADYGQRPYLPPTPSTPDWVTPDNPPGYGEARPPSGGFSADASELIDASQAWDELSGALKTVWNEVQEGWGQAGLFGIYDALYIAGTLHKNINEALTNAAADGHWITQGVADGLVEVANDFSQTDQTQGDNFRVLKERA